MFLSGPEMQKWVDERVATKFDHAVGEVAVQGQTGETPVQQAAEPEDWWQQNTEPRFPQVVFE